MNRMMTLTFLLLAFPALAQMTRVELVEHRGEGRGEQVQEKSIANSLIIDGVFGAVWAGGSVAMTVGRIENNSFTRTTGTLRLELWAVLNRPGRGDGFTGYQLAVSSGIAPLSPRTFYTDLVRTTSFTPPPDGTYWIVMVLAEFNPTSCPSDNYCLEDSGVFSAQSTFGNPAPPPAPPSVALENPQPGSYQSGIGLVSGWACSGALTATVGAINVPVAYGTPRQDVTGVCGSGNVNTGFGVLFNYNSLGAGVHTARIFRSGIQLASATFTVTVPAGEFMTGVSREVSVTNFPTFGRNATLIWQQSQQNFAIKSVFP